MTKAKASLLPETIEIPDKIDKWAEQADQIVEDLLKNISNHRTDLRGIIGETVKMSYKMGLQDGVMMGARAVANTILDETRTNEILGKPAKGDGDGR